MENHIIDNTHILLFGYNYKPHGRRDIERLATRYQIHEATTKVLGFGKVDDILQHFKELINRKNKIQFLHICTNNASIIYVSNTSSSNEI